MTIYLSYLTFTDQDDIVPMSGTDRIRTSGIVNTLAGNDVINASNEINNDDDDIGFYSDRFAFHNSFGTLNTAEGNDSITGIVSQNIDYFFNHYGINNDYGGKIYTGAGSDMITGIVQAGIYGSGIYNGIGNIINTGDGDDSITGISPTGVGITNQGGTIDTGDGQDTITGIGLSGMWLDRNSVLDTGRGNDTIITTNIKIDDATINTGDGEDSIIYQRESFINTGGVFLGESNDSIIGDTDFPNSFLQNLNIIETGNGDDIITSTGPILNSGIIDTGNGDDSIIVDADIDDINGTTYGIQNYGGAINMGDGNDSIIANKGFESAENSSGAWFLGEGDDYIKGYGSGDFYGGNGNDTLELTPGTYSVGIWGEGWDTSAIFTKGNQLMITSEFEKLKAGSTIYDFTSLTAGQIITVV